MKSIAKSLGMAEPEIDYEIGDDTEVTTSVSTKVEPVEGQQVAPEFEDDAYEDQRIREGDQQLDKLIREGMAAIRETFEKASDYEPRSQSRAREVGATLMNATLAAIKQKQEIANKQKEYRAKKKTASGPNTVSHTQINNIYANRNEILKMLEGDVE